MMQTAISYLRRLPIYFSQCQDLVVNSRRSQLVQKFVLALTQGGPSGQVFRAMDLHVHDAVRYVGDMLAWMHQAIASEEEFLEAVFGDSSTTHVRKKKEMKKNDIKDNGNTNSDSNNSNNDNSNASNNHNGCDSDQKESTSPSSSSSSKANPELIGLSIQELLARCLQGLGRPLRVRILQVNGHVLTPMVWSDMIGCNVTDMI